MSLMLNLNPNSNQTISTIDLRILVNEARKDSGESEVRNDQFIARVEDELEEQIGACKNFTHPQNKVEVKYYDLTLEQAMLVAMRESKAVRRVVVTKLKELQGVKEDKPAITSEVAGHFAALEIVGRSLNMSEAGKLGMYTKYAKANEPKLLPALPIYAIDTPLIAGSQASSSEAAFSATDLLKKFKSPLSARKFNQLAEKHGFLETKTRSSTKYPGVGRTYWSIANLYYGKNVTNSNNEKETQPYWYESKFEELLTKLN